MCKVIAVSNQKGGVGKTVSCVNLGIGLAQAGKKVLLIDADPQGSLTISLGYEEPDEMEYSLATLMLNIVNDEKLDTQKTILHHKEEVDLIPSNIELSGIEVSLSATPVQVGKFSWNVSWNFAKNNNKLLKLYPGTTRYKITNDSSGLVSLYAIEGEAYGQLFGRDFVYDSKGNRLVDANGKYLTSEPKALGSIIPDYTMGLKNSVKYGPVTLSFLFDFQKGGKYFANAYMLGMYTGTLRETTIQGMRDIIDKNGTKDQRGIVVPGVFAPGTPKAGQPNDKSISPKTYGSLFYRGVDSQNIFDATYFKLRSVTLSYDVPLAEKKHIKGLNISLFGNNLWTTGLDWDGMDPEIAASNKGIGETSLPSTRSFGMSIGLKL